MRYHDERRDGGEVMLLTPEQVEVRCGRCVWFLGASCWYRCMPPHIERHGPAWARRLTHCPKGRPVPPIESLIKPGIMAQLGAAGSDAEGGVEGR